MEKKKNQASPLREAEWLKAALETLDKHNGKSNAKALSIPILLILWMLSFIFGFLFIFNHSDSPSIINIISKIKDYEIPLGLSIIAAAIVAAASISYRQVGSLNFSDIDRNNTIYKITTLKASTLDDNTAENKQNFLIDEHSKCESFNNYFTSIIASLNEQIEIADKKASLLLDKGTSYSRNGIILYISVIIIWQVITWITDLQTRHIYGIASCSLLFIFIEFLSAWFLKQYRHFVDTSTYLIKLRSTLERYILTYLALKEVKANGGNFDPLIDLLKSEIKWPEMAQKDMQDISAPKELIDSLSNLCSAFKKNS